MKLWASITVIRRPEHLCDLPAYLHTSLLPSQPRLSRYPLNIHFFCIVVCSLIPNGCLHHAKPLKVWQVIFPDRVSELKTVKCFTYICPVTRKKANLKLGHI